MSVGDSVKVDRPLFGGHWTVQKVYRGETGVWLAEVSNQFGACVVLVADCRPVKPVAVAI